MAQHWEHVRRLWFIQSRDGPENQHTVTQSDSFDSSLDLEQVKKDNIIDLFAGAVVTRRCGTKSGFGHHWVYV